MTSGRRQKAAEREAERRLARHAGSAAVSEALPSQTAYKDVRESVRRKRCDVTARRSCLCGVRRRSRSNLPHRELQGRLRAHRGEEVKHTRPLITSFMVVTTIMLQR